MLIVRLLDEYATDDLGNPFEQGDHPLIDEARAFLAEPDGAQQQHARDSQELRRLCQARDDLKRANASCKAEIEALRAEVARLEKRRPLDAAEMREFIGSNFVSAEFTNDAVNPKDLLWGGAIATDNDRWLVTTHDLLSSFDILEDWQRPAAATQPAPVPEAGGLEK